MGAKTRAETESEFSGGTETVTDTVCIGFPGAIVSATFDCISFVVAALVDLPCLGPLPCIPTTVRTRLQVPVTVRVA